MCISSKDEGDADSFRTYVPLAPSRIAVSAERITLVAAHRDDGSLQGDGTACPDVTTQLRRAPKSPQATASPLDGSPVTRELRAPITNPRPGARRRPPADR